MKKGFVLFLVLFSSLVMLVGLWPQIAPLFAAAEPDGLDLFFQSNQLFGAGLSYDVALGDVDGDGDLDALLAKNGPNEVWLNDGTAVFTQNQQLGSDFNKGVALGDLDGDMDLDAFIANGSDGTPDRVWLNDGVGNFAVMTQTLGTYTSEKVALADVDMDDDLDAFVTACSHPLYNIFNTNVLWLNRSLRYSHF